jgi:ABC-type nitrate/sulfonate/bicarbonate transport system permease component
MLAAPAGLGHLIQYYAGLLQMEAVLGIILFLALGVTGLVYIFDLIEAWLLRWRKV